MCIRDSDNLLLDDLDPFFNLDGLVVTAVLSFDPGFAARYEATPFALSPPDELFPSFLCHAGDPSSKPVGAGEGIGTGGGVCWGDSSGTCVPSVCKNCSPGLISEILYD